MVDIIKALKSNRWYLEYLAILIFLILVGILYIFNLTRDVWGDSGDLVTAAYVFGVAHPSGYPLFTFLGYFFSHLPLPQPPVFRVGLISVFSSLLTLFILFKHSFRVTKNIAMSLLTVSILAFSYLFWFYTEVPDVFALNSLFAVLLIFLATLFYQEKKMKYLYLLVFFSALSLTHQETIILIFPSIIFLVLKRTGIIIKNKRNIIIMFLSALLGFTPFLYIPIAASHNPVINWDHASNISNFLYLILRKDYGSAPGITSNFPLFYKLFFIKHYFQSTIESLTLPTILICVAGALKLFKKDKGLSLSLVFAFILSGPLFALYFFVFYIPYTNILYWLGAIERFYILPTLVLMFFFPYGLIYVNELLDSKFSEMFGKFIFLVLFFIPLFLLITNYKTATLSSSQIGNNYAKDVLTPVPNKTALLVAGDNPTFNLWYLHFVLGKRADVDFIHEGGVGGGSIIWFNAMQEFFRRKGIQSVNLSDIYKYKIDIFKQLASNRPVLSTGIIDLGNSDLIWVPLGVTYILTKKSDIPSENDFTAEVEKAWKKINSPTRDNLLPSEQNFMIAKIVEYYSSVLFDTGNFYKLVFKDYKMAQKYYKKAVEIDPENPDAYSELGLASFELTKNCREAEEAEKTAIDLSYSILSSPKQYYANLYLIYKACKDQKGMNPLINEYNSAFHEDIKKNFK